MKVIKVKRLVYSHNPNMAHINAYGGYEYDYKMSDKYILDSIYEPGNWDWSPCWTNMLEKHTYNQDWYIQVRTFYHYEKSWYNLLTDNIKRILQI